MPMIRQICSLPLRNSVPLNVLGSGNQFPEGPEGRFPLHGDYFWIIALFYTVSLPVLESLV
jgi:hypothetical protein